MPKKYGRSVFLFFGCWDGDTRYVLRSVPHDCAGVPQDLKRLCGQGLLSQGFGGHKSIVKHHSCHRHASQILQFCRTSEICQCECCAGRSSWILIYCGKIVSDQRIITCSLFCHVLFVMLCFLCPGQKRSNFHFCCGANIRHVCIYVCMIHTIESIHLHYLMSICNIALYIYIV